MRRDKQYSRFPRTAFARRVGRIMYELREHRRWTLEKTLTVTSPVLQARLEERANDLDDVWHALEQAQRTLAYMR